MMRSDIEIAQAARPRPITDVAAELGLATDDLELYGKFKAKIPLEFIPQNNHSSGKLILVTGINPTPAGEGKSTLSVGLTRLLL